MASRSYDGMEAEHCYDPPPPPLPLKCTASDPVGSVSQSSSSSSSSSLVSTTPGKAPSRSSKKGSWFWPWWVVPRSERCVDDINSSSDEEEESKSSTSTTSRAVLEETTVEHPLFLPPPFHLPLLIVAIEPTPPHGQFDVWQIHVRSHTTRVQDVGAHVPGWTPETRLVTVHNDAVLLGPEDRLATYCVAHTWLLQVPLCQVQNWQAWGQRAQPIVRNARVSHLVCTVLCV
jgi:hypothetical protein